MINTASLSLEQAPPISVPFRFFLTAPLFSSAAAVQLFFFGEQILSSRWLPVTLSFTHLLTLGFLAMVMCGAVLQMLPVMAGAPVGRVRAVGGATHLLVSAGTALLAAWFLGRGSLYLALLLLAAGFGIFLFAVGKALWLQRESQPGAPVRGMRLASLALAVTVVLGLLAALSLADLLPLRELALVTNVHAGWGIAGWVGLLLVSVAFQLVPMFNVTPEYPRWMRVYLPGSIFSLLVGWSLLEAWGAARGAGRDAWFLLLVIASAYLLFAFVTLDLQRRRKRKIPDVTLMFWRTGLLAMIACVVLWVAALLYPPLAGWTGFDAVLGGGLLIGFALSIVNGMLYKIVPFLSWFHLQNRQMASMNLSVTIPHMKAFISDRAGRVQFALHLAALATLVAAVVDPPMLARAAAALFLASNLLLGVNLWVAVRRFRRHYSMLQAVD